MSLMLLLQTSNGVPMLGFARDDQIVFDTSALPEWEGSRDYRAMVDAGLKALGAQLSDLTAISVDIGPGGMGVTRTGASFANALGFALGLPVLAIPAFEMLGAQVAKGDTPVVLLRKAARPYVHFGIYRDGQLAHYEHLTRDEALDQIKELDEFNLAGNVPLEGFEPPLTNAATLRTMLTVARSKPAPAPQARAYPIVEVLE
ncbi:hypothetical protein [Celeribacter sp.]|uniref:hypothetical protein n=1 Tax=Celeribacter sp. TaxID=1890673 RepID=UPI003A9341ED